MEKIKVGLIGYGMAGSIFHAPLLNALGEYELSKIVTSQPDKVLKDFTHVDIVTGVEDLFSDSEIELVVIASPNTTHFDLAKSALQAGKHVVVDKPFTNRSFQAEELIQIAEKEKRLLSVFQNRRWDNDFLTVKKVIEQGLLGNIYTFETHYDRFRPQIKVGWREEKLEGSGLLYDLGAHLIDQALHLFGLPKEITGDIRTQRKAMMDDYFHLVLGYDQLRVILHSGCLVAEPGAHFQVHGDKGSFVKFGMDSQEATLKLGQKPCGPGWGVDPVEQQGLLVSEIDGLPFRGKIETIPGSYESFYEEMAQAIRNNGPVPVDPVDAKNTIRMIELARLSQKEGRSVPAGG